MAGAIATKVEEFFRQRAEDDLRSVIQYEPESFEAVYMRDDVAEQYTREEIERAVDDSRMESLSAPIYEHVFSEDHGELTCLVKCFEEVVEMNFVVSDGTGTTVALDAEALDGAHGLVVDARQIVVEGRSQQ